MAVYEIKEFSGGLSDYEEKGIKGAFKFGSNLDIRKEVDSLSSGQRLVDEGLLSSHSPSLSVSPSSSASRSPSPSVSRSISPTPSPSASQSPSVSVSRSPSTTPSSSISPSPSPSEGLTTVFHGCIRFFVKATDGFTYGFDSVGYVYRRDSDAFWQRVYKDADGAIKGAYEWYDRTSNKTQLYWATDTKLKRKPLPGLANWNDVEVVATNLESATWHTMREAGGALMICNRQYMAMVGYDGSYTNEALLLVPGNTAQTLVERNGRAIIGTSRIGYESKGINGMIDTEVQLAQIGDDGEIIFANMSDTIPVKRFPGGGKVNPGGVTSESEPTSFFEWEQTALSWIDKQSVTNMAIFGIYGADSGKNGLYYYGRRKKDAPFTLNLEYVLEVDEIGAVVNVDGTTLASYRDGTDFGVMAVDTTAKEQGIYEGLDFRAPIKNMADITTWKFVELFMSPLPTGATIQYYYKMNKTGAWELARTADGEVSYTTAGGKKAVFTVQAEGEVFSHKIVLNPTGNDSPEIYRERVYFQ